jgi:hypothetical protein
MLAGDGRDQLSGCTPRNEGGPRREAPLRELRQPISGPQFRRRLAEAGHEPGVGLIHRLADELADGVDPRCRRALALPRLGERVLPQYRGRAEWLDSRFVSARFRSSRDRLDERGNLRPVLLWREMTPARQGLELEHLWRGVLAGPKSSPRLRAANSWVRSNQVPCKDSPVRRALTQWTPGHS